MVGHTGDIDATVVACKAADDAVKVYLIFIKFMLPLFQSVELIEYACLDFHLMIENPISVSCFFFWKKSRASN